MLVVAERRDQRRLAREPRELDRGDRAAPGGLLEGVPRVHHLPGARHVADARELHPLDVSHDRHPHPAGAHARQSHTARAAARARASSCSRLRIGCAAWPSRCSSRSPPRTSAVLTLNRPDQLNAMTSELCEALHEELRRISIERSVRAVVLTGAGRGFCAGLDLAGYGAAPGNDGSDESRDRLDQPGAHVAPDPRAARAAPAGDRRGERPRGGLRARRWRSDATSATPPREAVFRAAFLNIGVSNCDMATSWLLPRLIGASRAHELMLTGAGASTPRRRCASGSSPTSLRARSCPRGRSRRRSRSRRSRRGECG